MNKQVEAIRREIEKRIGSVNEKQDANPAMPKYRWHMFEGMKEAFRDMKYFIDSLPEEKPSEDLEEAAARYERENRESILSSVDIVDGFIAGAEWQKEQMELDGIVTLTESDFDAEKEKASEWGYNLCKEQMMKEAVDYKIVNNLAAYPVIYYEVNHLGLKYGDKVKIIIVKQ